MRLLLFILLVGAALAQEAGQPISSQPVDFRHPARAYTVERRDGWQLHLEKELAVKEPALAEKAAAKLSSRLERLLAILPSQCASLKEMPVFLLYGPKATAGGYDNGAQYFKSNEPDYYPTLDLRWRHCLVVYCAGTYHWLDELWSTKSLCHELAHAWQYQRYGQEQPDLQAAFANAQRLGLYRNVTDENGKVLTQAYAMTNDLEYFAELSCMYFVGCNYAPHNREELRAYDPAGYAMVEKLWGLKKAGGNAGP